MTFAAYNIQCSQTQRTYEWDLVSAFLLLEMYVCCCHNNDIIHGKSQKSQHNFSIFFTALIYNDHDSWLQTSGVKKSWRKQNLGNAMFYVVKADSAIFPFPGPDKIPAAAEIIKLRNKMTISDSRRHSLWLSAKFGRSWTFIPILFTKIRRIQKSWADLHPQMELVFADNFCHVGSFCLTSAAGWTMALTWMKTVCSNTNWIIKG